jgi:hypothetical protein
MKHFEEILQTIGATKRTLLKESPHWDMWRVVYPTPAQWVHTYYLYLKHSCPLKEGTSENVRLWRSLSNNENYHAILTPKGELKRHRANVAARFGAKDVLLSTDLLHRTMAQKLAVRDLDVETYFVEPDVRTETDDVQPAVRTLIEWFEGIDATSANRNLAVMRADGGAGKTTLARTLAREIRQRRPKVVPLFIGADQWRHQLHAQFSIPNVWDIALTRCLQTPAGLLSNEPAFNVLVREGLIWIIFDGFDELCLHPQFSASPADVVQSFLDDLVAQDEVSSSSARILLTSRDSYWRSYEPQMPVDSLTQFTLLGFSNAQKKEYFQKRLAEPAKVSNALRYCSEIGGRLYEGIPHEQPNKERMEGTPFVLDLVAEAFEGPETEESSPYRADPLEDILLRVCRRENLRQGIQIPPERQLAFFEELFREKPGRISEEDLRMYLEVICGVQDPTVQEKFRIHFLLRRAGQNTDQGDSDDAAGSDGVFLPRYEVLRTYFLARFLSRELLSLRERSGWRRNAAVTLAESGGGRTPVVEWLLGQLRRQPFDSVREALRHGFTMIKDPSGLPIRNKAGCALFGVVTRWLTEDDKAERTATLKYLMSLRTAGPNEIEEGFFSGIVSRFDFRGMTLRNCYLEDCEFRNCVFDNSTTLLQSDVSGSLNFFKCSGEQDIRIDDSSLSGEAQYTLAKLRGAKLSEDVARTFAEEILEHVLRKFRGPFGFHSIQYGNRLKGLPRGNPFREYIWDALLKHNIVERHAISHVAGGGLNISEDLLIRREVQGVFDNAHIGTRLRRVVDDLVADR